MWYQTNESFIIEDSAIRMNDNWWLRRLQGDSCQIHNRCMRRHKCWLLHALIDRSCRAPKSIVAMLYSYQSISTQPETNISPRLKPNQFWILDFALSLALWRLDGAKNRKIRLVALDVCRFTDLSQFQWPYLVGANHPQSGQLLVIATSN